MTLFDESDEQRMTSLADLLSVVAASGLHMTAEEIAALNGWSRRRAEVEVLAKQIRRVRHGRPLPPDVQAAFDQVSAGYVGAPPEIGAGQDR